MSPVAAPLLFELDASQNPGSELSRSRSDILAERSSADRDEAARFLSCSPDASPTSRRSDVRSAAVVAAASPPAVDARRSPVGDGRPSRLVQPSFIRWRRGGDGCRLLRAAVRTPPPRS